MAEQQNNPGSNNNQAERNLIIQITDFCMRTEQTFNNLSEQIDKIKDFHTDQKGKQAQFTTGVNKVEALENLNSISDGLAKAKQDIREMHSQLKQTHTSTKTTRVTFGPQGRREEDIINEEDKDN